MGQDFVFEDTDEQTEVWELEARLAREPPAGEETRNICAAALRAKPCH